MAMFSKLKQFKEVRDQAKKARSVLEEVRVEGSGGWGKVKVGMTGNQEVTHVTIDPELLAGKDGKKVGEAAKDAFNDAVKKAQREMADLVKKGDLKLPDLG
jgi:DNA-binding YbaB/EbfC family protein